MKTESQTSPELRSASDDPGARILVIDDEESLRYTFDRFLKKEGHDVHTAADYETAMTAIAADVGFDLIFADIVLPGSYTGLDFLMHANEQGVDCPIIMITGQPEIESATEAVRQGAFDYVPKPVRQSTLLRLARSALKFHRMEKEKHRIEKENQQVRRHMEAVFQSVEEAIITVDRNMRVISANHAAAYICGIAAPEMANRQLTARNLICRQKCGRIAEDTLKKGQAFRDVRVECARDRHTPKLLAVNSAPLKGASGRKHGAVLVIRDITRIQQLERELKKRQEFRGIIGKSEAMQEIYRLLEDLSELETAVLITGESGTGKELIANALHAQSNRAQGPLVKVNCSALSENLLESELFGHVKGAFTGAARDKTGRFEMAHGGTLFLDEIGDIVHSVQLKLLRVLQEKEIERVGDAGWRKVDVRVVSATNQKLAEKIRQGLFREDLYYRLKVMNLHLPALRERREDIPLLMEHFREELNASMHRKVEGFSDEAMARCLQYEWPGNIRQLKHCLEHAFVLCRGPVLLLEHLPPELRPTAPASESHAPAGSIPVSRDAIASALTQCGGNKAKAARQLGVSRQTLYRKIHEYDISS